jgi:hypothetical protein
VLALKVSFSWERETCWGERERLVGGERDLLERDLDRRSEASDSIKFLFPGAAINLANGVFGLALAARNNLGDGLEGGHGASGDLVRMGFAVEFEPVCQVLDLALPRDLAWNLCHWICHVEPIELAVDLCRVRGVRVNPLSESINHHHHHHSR